MIIKTLKMIDKNAERWLLLVFYMMLVSTMAIEVLRREIFSYSSIWGEEIVRYSFIYLAWIGAAAAFKDRAHIRIDVLMYYVNVRIKSLLVKLSCCVRSRKFWLTSSVNNCGSIPRSAADLAARHRPHSQLRCRGFRQSW